MICNYCEWRCDLSMQQSVCKRYALQGGAVAEVEPFHWSTNQLLLIEEVPLFHAIPNSMIMLLGTAGCNASCDYCINSPVSLESDPNRKLEYIPAEKLLRDAIDQKAEAVIFAWNEVTVYAQSALAMTKAARDAGLRVGCLTNGYQTAAFAAQLGKEMDFINISLKAMNDGFYQKYLGLPSVAPVLRNIKSFADLAHIEIVTPLVGDISADEILSMRDFIADISPHIPWHLFKLFPTHKRTRDDAWSFDEVMHVMEQVKEKLPYVYFTNIPGSKWVHTFCLQCGHKLIGRISIGVCGAKLNAMDICEGKCPVCGEKAPILY